VPENLTAPAVAIARELEAEISAALADAGRGERLREGFVVAIAGPPNAGKSTLLNRLAKREAAIVSPYAGTTRDVIEVHLDLNGLPVTLLDTAGIRETDDPVEMEGVRRARERAAAADLVLWVVDASEEGGEAGSALPGRPAADGSRATEVGSAASKPGRPASDASSLAGRETDPPVWLIRNKADLLPAANAPAPSDTDDPSASAPAGRKDGSHDYNRQSFLQRINEPISQSLIDSFIVSSTTGIGVDALVAALTAAAGRMLGAEPALVTRERHRLALEDARSALGRIAAGPLAEDLVAEEFRLAARALQRLTGRVDVEDVLDVIFRDFCIGK
jgi:tRNA modification GTPase